APPCASRPGPSGPWCCPEARTRTPAYRPRSHPASASPPDESNEVLDDRRRRLPDRARELPQVGEGNVLPVAVHVDEDHSLVDRFLVLLKGCGRGKKPELVWDEFKPLLALHRPGPEAVAPTVRRLDVEEVADVDRVPSQDLLDGKAARVPAIRE